MFRDIKNMLVKDNSDSGTGYLVTKIWYKLQLSGPKKSESFLGRFYMHFLHFICNI